MTSTFNCPHCKNAIENDPALAGQLVQCPHCQDNLTMPEASESTGIQISTEPISLTIQKKYSFKPKEEIPIWKNIGHNIIGMIVGFCLFLLPVVVGWIYKWFKP